MQSSTCLASASPRPVGMQTLRIAQLVHVCANLVTLDARWSPRGARLNAIATPARIGSRSAVIMATDMFPPHRGCLRFPRRVVRRVEHAERYRAEATARCRDGNDR